jgi:hypothetical protein
MPKSIFSVINPILQASNKRLNSFDEGRINRLSDSLFSSKTVSVDEVIKQLDKDFYRYFDEKDLREIRKKLSRM